MSDLQIHSVQFTDDGAVVQFMRRTDVRVRGRVVQTRMVQMSASHPDYEEDIANLQKQARLMLNNALEDFENSEPWSPDEPDEDDDERGMGE